MKKLAFGLVLVLLGWLGLELAAFVLLWIRDGVPSWPGQIVAQRTAVLAEASESPHRVLDSEEAELARLARGGSEEEVLHPYLGYVVNPEINKIQHRRKKGRLVVSELGFFEPPGKSKLDAGSGAATGPPLRVGIFGGSVAFIFSFTSRDRLAAALATLPGVGDRPIVIRSFALGRYKQPQQLEALAYLLALGEQFDVVINIDGFNDIVVPYLQNIPQGVTPVYPANWPGRVGQLPDPDLDVLRGQSRLSSRSPEATSATLLAAGDRDQLCEQFSLASAGFQPGDRDRHRRIQRAPSPATDPAISFSRTGQALLRRLRNLS